jgi:hypothetical protein
VPPNPIFGEDFLDKLVSLHFPGGKPTPIEKFLIIYTTCGRVFPNNGDDRIFSIPAFSLAGAPFTIPGIGVIAPSCDVVFHGNPDGSGSATASDGPFTREGIPNIGDVPPADDQISEEMIKKLKAWQGQYERVAKLTQGPAGSGDPIGFCNIDGYLVVNLTNLPKTTTTWTARITAPHVTNQGDTEVHAATWKNKLVHTVMETTGDRADSITVDGTGFSDDHLPDFVSFSPPAHAISYAFAGHSGSTPTNIRVTVNVLTLQVTVTDLG